MTLQWTRIVDNMNEALVRLNFAVSPHELRYMKTYLQFTERLLAHSLEKRRLFRNNQKLF